MSAQFYEKAFGLKRLKQNNEPVTLADGVVSITILKSSSPAVRAGTSDEPGKEFVGIHHFGFIVEDLEETAD